MTGEAVAAEELAIAPTLIVDQQRGIKLRQPGAQDVVSARTVLFHVVIDQMAVGAREIIPDRVEGPKKICKYFQLQGEIQQVVLQAVFAEADRAVLCVR